MVSSFSHDHFIECLQQCPGGPWTLFEAQQQLDALVLQPLLHSTDSERSDGPFFVDFLANTFHRRLVRLFVGGNSGRIWTLEALMKQARPPSPQALLDALECCRVWQIACLDEAMSVWQGHPRLASLNNLGWTFEYVTQAVLERSYGAVVRRHVKLGEMMALGEIDVLAFLSNMWSRILQKALKSHPLISSS